MITYRLEGGYFTSPRWCGKYLRRGKMRGRIMHVWKPDQLRAMKPGEIYEKLCADLYEDAYATQRREMVPFRGKRLAEHLETVLCLCPRCGALDTLTSRDDTLSCGCGFHVKYNEYGFFEGEDAPFDNVTDWDREQTEKLIARMPAEGLVFSDGDVILTETLPGHRSRELGRGSMALYTDRLECCGQTFALAKMHGFALHGAQTVNMSWQGRDFEIASDKVRCTRKYMLMIRHLTGQEKK